MSNYSASAGPISYAQEQQSFLVRVFTLLGIGLLGSFVAAYGTYTTGYAGSASAPSFWPMIIGLAPLGIILFLAFRMSHISKATAYGLYWLFCLTNGIGLSYIFITYNIGDIQQAFAAAGATFLAAAFYGYTTKTDLSKFGNIMMMALFGLIIASVINIFWANSTLYWVVTYAGVLIFVVLTAVDMQKVKNRNQLGNAGTDEDHKEAIWGAIELYLDFINLFLFMLRIFGNSRD